MSEEAMSRMTHDLFVVVITAIFAIAVLVATRKTKFETPGMMLFYGCLSLIIAAIYLFTHAAAPLIDIVLSLLSTPIFLIPCLLMGVLLFRLRGTSPLAYGIIEIGVGSAAISFVLSTKGGDLSAKLIGILGGIYIVIRGMDNAEKGMPTRIKSLWSAIFPKHV